MHAAVLLCKLPNYTFSSVTASRFIQLLWATATTSDDVSIPACEDEAHLAASTEKDEEFLWVRCGGPRNTYCHGRGSDINIESED